MTNAAWAIAAALVCAGSARAAEEEFHLKVHLLSDDERVELRRAGDGATLCRTPCDALVRYRSGDEFVLAGPGLVQSDPLFFHPRDGEVTLQVVAGAQAPRIVAAVMGAVGVAAFSAGAIAWIPAGVAYGLCDRGNCSAERTAATVVQVAVVGGLVLAAVGLVVFLASPPTRFSVEPSQAGNGSVPENTKQ